MLSGLPTELIIMSCQYLSFRDVDELAYTTKRMMQMQKPDCLSEQICVMVRETLLFKRGSYMFKKS